MPEQTCDWVHEQGIDLIAPLLRRSNVAGLRLTALLLATYPELRGRCEHAFNSPFPVTQLPQQYLVLALVEAGCADMVSKAAALFSERRQPLDLNVVNTLGLSVMHLAARQQSPDWVALLDRLGADCTLVCANGETPFQLAMRQRPVGTGLQYKAVLSRLFTATVNRGGLSGRSTVSEYAYDVARQLRLRCTHIAQRLQLVDEELKSTPPYDHTRVGMLESTKANLNNFLTCIERARTYFANLSELRFRDGRPFP